MGKNYEKINLFWFKKNVLNDTRIYIYIYIYIYIHECHSIYRERERKREIEERPANRQTDIDGEFPAKYSYY